MATLITLQTDDLSLATRILALVRESQDAERPSASPVAGFIHSLPPSCHTFVMQVADASRRGTEKRRSELRNSITIGGQPIGADDTRFNGITGSVGRVWRRFFPERPNPFVGRPVAGDVVYLLDVDFARQLSGEAEIV
jgi:hypothetical protein